MEDLQDFISISEYAKLNKVSPQSVYARIKRGTLQSKEVNGITMVLNSEFTSLNKGNLTIHQDNNNEFSNMYKEIIKIQTKEIKRLNKRILKLESFIDKLIGIDKDNTDNIYDVKPIKKKKNKKKKR